MRRLPLVHALAAALVNDALGIAENDVLPGYPHCFDQFDAGDRCCAGAIAHELEILEIAPGDLQRIYQAGRGNNGRAVLIVMEDRDVHELAQTLLDDETIRCLDIFEIDPSERRSE